MGRKGFTLMELIIVIIILGILATIAFRQYAVTMEKSRASEARNSIGSIRQEAYDFYIRNVNTLNPATGSFDDESAGIDNTGAGTPGLLPGGGACQGANYFTYAVVVDSDTQFTATATRCTAGGKIPDFALPGAAPTVSITSDLAAGVDTWTGTGVYK